MTCEICGKVITSDQPMHVDVTAHRRCADTTFAALRSQLAEAREECADLKDRLRRAQFEAAAIREALVAVEYGSCDGCHSHQYCSICDAEMRGEATQNLHARDCVVGKALGRVKP